MEDYELGSLPDQVENITKINFGVSGCPAKAFKKFKIFSAEKANGSYALAIERLIEVAEANMKEIYIFGELRKLNERVDKLEEKKKDKIPKGFGNKN